MNGQTLALIVAQEHNQIDCCEIHRWIFDRAIGLIGLGNRWEGHTELTLGVN